MIKITYDPSFFDEFNLSEEEINGIKDQLIEMLMQDLFVSENPSHVLSEQDYLYTEDKPRILH